MLPTKDQSLHHAYIIEGNLETTKKLVLDFLEERFELVVGHPDLFLIEASMFGVEEAEQVVVMNGRKAFHKKEKGILITADSFSHQAQNALLKTLEEPYPGTHIFIVTSSASTFLPTVLSRVQVIRPVISSSDAVQNLGAQRSAKQDLGSRTSKVKTDQAGEYASELDALQFLKSSRVSRLSMVKDIMKLKEKEHIGDREIFAFLTELEERAHTAAIRTDDTVQTLEVARVMTIVADFMRDTSSSKKMLLEYAALRLPLF